MNLVNTLKLKIRLEQDYKINLIVTTYNTESEEVKVLCLELNLKGERVYRVEIGQFINGYCIRKIETTRDLLEKNFQNVELIEKKGIIKEYCY